MGAASESGSGLEFGAESLDGAGLAIILGNDVYILSKPER